MRRDGVAADSKTVSTIVFGCLKGRMHAQAVEVVLNVSLEPTIAAVSVAAALREGGAQQSLLRFIGFAFVEYSHSMLRSQVRVSCFISDQALESLRGVNSRAPNRQSQRNRQGAGASGRKQSLPAVDEKTVRFLACHLREQNMHQVGLSLHQVPVPGFEGL